MKGNYCINKHAGNTFYFFCTIITYIKYVIFFQYVLRDIAPDINVIVKIQQLMLHNSNLISKIK